MTLTLPLAQVTSLLLTILILSLATSFWTGLLVQDKSAEKLRRWIWTRWPYAGYMLPEELEGSSFEEITARTGTMIGYLFTCVRCLGVWIAIPWEVAYVLAPAATIRVAALFAVCQAQRFWNRLTPMH